MKFETTASNLAKALKTLASVIERRNTIPVLGTVMFDGRTIRGTDLDIDLSVSVPATVAKGTVCIDHRPLLALVGNIPGDEHLSIAGDKDSATVTFSVGRYDLPSLPASDWPSVEAGETTGVPVDGAVFKRSLGFVAPFMSIDETRYYLNGVCLDGRVSVATDGHRLGCHPSGADFTAFGRPILPKKAARILQSLPAPKAIQLNDRRFVADLDGARLVTRLIDGTYPEWQRVVPANTETTSRLTIIDPQSMSRSLARIASVMGMGRAYVTIAFDNTGLVVTGRRDGTVVREYVSHTILTGQGKVVAFQANYLRDILSVFSAGDAISLSITDANAPIRVETGGHPHFAILMPARSDETKLAPITLAEWGASRATGRAA